MKHDRGTLTRQVTRGPRLHTTSTVPDGPTKAVIGLLHGYADYGERYEHVMDVWAGRGIATVTVDMRGHGRAEGRRGHCEHFSEFLDDAAELTRLVQLRVEARDDAQAPGPAAFLFGHSFGGLVAAQAAIARPSPWRALILSGPFFGVSNGVPRLKQLAGRLASRLVPAFAQPTGIRGADLTHDAVRARAYDDDPLVFKNATARWFTETSAAQDRAIERAPALSMPLYVVLGADDPVVSIPRARAFFDAAGSRDKTWDSRPGLLHEVLNETSWRPVADSIADWVLSRSERPAS